MPYRREPSTWYERIDVKSAVEACVFSIFGLVLLLSQWFPMLTCVIASFMNASAWDTYRGFGP